MTDLKPCPFCGKVPHLEPFNDNPKMAAVVCGHGPCDKSGLLIALADRGDGYQPAITAWNTRAAPQPACLSNTAENGKQPDLTPVCGAQPPVSDQEKAEALTSADYEEVLADHRRLVRELDVALNGEEGAAKQASLCDIVRQVKREGIRSLQSKPVPDALTDDELLELFYEKTGLVIGSDRAGGVIAFARQAISAAQSNTVPQGDAWLKIIEDNCWDVRCVEVTTGGDDADIAWHVVEHHMAAPQERVVGYGLSPLEALQNAAAAPETSATGGQGDE